MHPRAQISQGDSYSLSFTDSGDIYNGVPLNSHLCSVLTSSVFDASLANPKSAILATPLSNKRIFWSFISQWTNPFAWTKERPLSIDFVCLRISGSGNLPPWFLSLSAKLPPEAYSNSRLYRFSRFSTLVSSLKHRMICGQVPILSSTLFSFLSVSE